MFLNHSISLEKFYVNKGRRYYKNKQYKSWASFAQLLGHFSIFVQKLGYMSIGTNLRRLRNRTKLSQEEVADRLGIDRKTYANWENEYNDIKSEYIPSLAEIFDVEISELFQDSHSKVTVNQNNTDNKEHSTNINGMVLVLTDKEAVNQVVEVLKDKLGK